VIRQFDIGKLVVELKMSGHARIFLPSREIRIGDYFLASFCIHSISPGLADALDVTVVEVI
jgi:hypothetical protein